MKKQILLAVGVAGTLLCNPQPDLRADVRVGVGVSGPGFFFESRPDFIYLDDYGLSVSYGGPYDVIYYGDAYYIFRDGGWYRAYDYRGPWGRIRDFDLPPAIRRHGWNDIRRFRDREYRRHDRRFWNDRFRHDREQWRMHYERRGPGDRRGFEGRPGPGDHRGFDERRGPDDRWDRDDRRGPDHDRRDGR